jgi:hypothetical protein
MQNKIIFKKIIFMGLLCMLFMLVGCDGVPNNPGISEDNSYFIFLEYGMYNEGEYKDGSLRLHINGDGGCYFFDEKNYRIRIIMPEDVKIDNSDKFVFGKYVNTESNNSRDLLVSGKTNLSLTGQESFYKIDTLSARPFSVNNYEIKMIDCSSKGEAKVLFNNKEITLKPNEIFCDTLTYLDVTLNIYGATYSYNFIKDIVVIKNVGFMKKTYITYN